jgi:Zn finger protein HypA/HybF involved in hydrogenase expression
MHRIVGARWTPLVNMLELDCDGRRFEHRADRWNVRCPHCGGIENLAVLRDRYVAEGAAR